MTALEVFFWTRPPDRIFPRTHTDTRQLRTYITGYSIFRTKISCSTLYAHTFLHCHLFLLCFFYYAILLTLCYITVIFFTQSIYLTSHIGRILSESFFDLELSDYTLSGRLKSFPGNWRGPPPLEMALSGFNYIDTGNSLK